MNVSRVYYSLSLQLHMELVTYYFQCVGRTVTYIKYVGYENFDITSKQLVL